MSLESVPAYKTSRLYLAAFLSLVGCKYGGVEISTVKNRPTVYFVFTETALAKEFESKYMNNDAAVAPMEYAHSIQSFKEILHSALTKS